MGPDARDLFRQFNDLVNQLAGVRPGGPGASIDAMEEAHRRAVEIFGIDPTRWLW